ncbi:oncoprotein-induced transcript 3 protein-like [Ptychodera flava]|uniref:oncoprotein-induced transcript 3 protein-like n=1 Tax=Ptychodera flava TaxID=63121 RepID=UPI00396A5EB2
MALSFVIIGSVLLVACVAGTGDAAITVPRQQDTLNPCRSYGTLDQPDRNVNYKYEAKTRTVANADSYRCDTGAAFAASWYRFRSPAGNRLSTNIAVSGTLNADGSCGTEYGFYLDGNHPLVEEGVVWRRACTEKCSQSIDIQVKNCSGFYVYHLTEIDFCCGAYCAENDPSDIGNDDGHPDNEGDGSKDHSDKRVRDDGKSTSKPLEWKYVCIGLVAGVVVIFALSFAMYKVFYGPKSLV